MLKQLRTTAGTFFWINRDLVEHLAAITDIPADQAKAPPHTSLRTNTGAVWTIYGDAGDVAGWLNSNSNNATPPASLELRGRK